VNVEASLEPSNILSLGEVTRSKKKGTATIEADFPGPGDVRLQGSQLKNRTRPVVIEDGKGTINRVTAAGLGHLLIDPRGAKRRQLKSEGEVKIRFDVVFTPQGGIEAEQRVKLKLLKK
jgi:hypothetical protein